MTEHITPGEGVGEINESEQKRRDNLTSPRPSQEPNLASICRIPVEILGMIFEEAMIQRDSNATLESKQIARFTLLHNITSVSKTWRLVAIGNPNLWTNIWHLPDVNIQSDSTHPLRHYPYQLCIERSKGKPLDIYVKGTLCWVEVLEHLASASALNRVSSLSVEPIRPHGEPDQDELSRHLSSLACFNLKRLDLNIQDALGFQGLIELLKGHAGLQSLLLYDIWLDFEWTGPPVALPKLTSFQLVDVHREHIQPLVNGISAPNLRQLCLVLHDDADVHMHPLLPQQLLPVRDLILGGGITATESFEVIVKCPSAEILRLLGWTQLYDRNRPHHNEFFHLLSTQPQIAPKLHTLLLLDYAISYPHLNFLIDSRVESSEAVPIKTIAFETTTWSRFSIPEQEGLSEKVHIVERDTAELIECDYAELLKTCSKSPSS